MQMMGLRNGARSGAPLPYDAEVEWIGGDGVGAFIDTGVNLGDGQKQIKEILKYYMQVGIVEVEPIAASTTSYALSMGGNSGIAGTFGLGYKWSISSREPTELGIGGNCYGSIAGSAKYNAKIVNPEFPNTYTIFYNEDNYLCLSDGHNTVVATQYPTATVVYSDTQTFGIFTKVVRSTTGGFSNQYYSAAKISFYKLSTEFGEVDMIPVRFTNENGISEGAMYDRVSGQLFRNAGTGAFVIGPDKT